MIPYLLAQYEQMGAEVIVSASFSEEVFRSNYVDQVVILTSEEGRMNDAAAWEFLSGLSALSCKKNFRIPVFLLLHNSHVFHLLQTTGVPAPVDIAFELWPFTMEDVWARNLVVRMPGIRVFDAPSLDRRPIMVDSETFVHLVIAGTDSYAWEVAVQAALVCHFPNYDEKAPEPLRTRITFVSPGITAFRDAFIGRYPQLFAHSFYRTINLEEKSSFLHRPLYEGKRLDFVDVEWEFVEASVSHPQMARRLSDWAWDERRQLTLVLSGKEDAAVLSTCLSLPDAVFEKEVPVWILQRKSDWTGVLDASRHGSVYPFGMEDHGLDVRMPMVEMARLLHYCYSYRYQNQSLPTALPPDAVDLAWRNAGSLKMRYSNVYNVMAMSTKMRSLGHKGDDGCKFYALSPEEVEALAKTEHNRWSVERLLSGTRPCSDQERKEVAADVSLKRKYKTERDAHLDLCAYDELLPDESGTDVRENDRALTACIPLIVQTFLNRTEE